MSDAPTAAALRSRLVLHPLFLAALAALVLNDAVLKQAWPSVVTGKLSDGAGLVVLPVFLAAPFGFRQRGHVAACCLAAGLLLAAVQVPPVARALSVGPLHFTPDWTDLLALAVLPASYALICRQARCGAATPLPGRPALRRTSGCRFSSAVR